MTVVTADSKGRVSLGRKFAGKHVVIKEIDEFEVRSEMVEIIPAREM